MKRELKVAIGVSAGLHASLFFLARPYSAATFSVRTAPSSIELALVPSPAVGEDPRTPSPVKDDRDLPRATDPDRPRESEPGRSQPKPTGTPRQGAFKAPRADNMNAAPVYPEAARLLGYEGLVRLLVEVEADGFCGTVEVNETSGHAILDEAAVRAVQRWRFIPATFMGRPVSSRIDVPIRFRLAPEGLALHTPS